MKISLSEIFYCILIFAIIFFICLIKCQSKKEFKDIINIVEIYDSKGNLIDTIESENEIYSFIIKKKIKENEEKENQKPKNN